MEQPGGAAGRYTTRMGTVFALVPAGQDADRLLPDDVKANHMKYVSSVSTKDRVLVAVSAGDIMHYYCPPESVLLAWGKENLEKLAEELMKRHKASCRQWREGEIAQIWRDENGTLCIRYTSGNWWHYNDSGEWW